MDNKSYLKSFFTSYWGYLTVHAACKLNLFDNLLEAKPLIQVAEELSLNQHALSLLMDGLVSLGFLESSKDRYRTNQLSVFLTENHPESLKYACLNWGGEHLSAMQNLDFSIKTGKSSFSFNETTQFFEYLTNNPQKLINYHRAMKEYARDDYDLLPLIQNFGMHRSLMDVGGGFGAAIENIQCSNPDLKCYLFDLECVVSNAPEGAVTKIGGNFFEKIPHLAEAILMTRVLHDWDNEKALSILLNCYDALPSGGTLYIVENSTDKTGMDLSLLSLNMLVMCESFERKPAEYITLCQNAGFSFIDEKSVNQLQTLLIFKK